MKKLAAFRRNTNGASHFAKMAEVKVALPTTTKRKWGAARRASKARKTNKGTRAVVSQNPRVSRGIASGKNPLPFKLITKLAYNDKYLVTGAAGACAVRVYDASSLYDPDYSGGGHQPLGFDQLMPMYDHYVVLGSKITVRFANGTPASTVGVSGNAVVTPKTSASHYIEAGATKHQCCVYQANMPVITQGYSPKIHLGIENPTDADKLQGSETTNPTDNWFFHVFVEPLGSGDSANCYIDVTIEYTACFIEPKQLAQS